MPEGLGVHIRTRSREHQNRAALLSDRDFCATKDERSCCSNKSYFCVRECGNPDRRTSCKIDALQRVACLIFFSLLIFLSTPTKRIYQFWQLQLASNVGEGKLQFPYGEYAFEILVLLNNKNSIMYNRATIIIQIKTFQARNPHSK